MNPYISGLIVDDVLTAIKDGSLLPKDALGTVYRLVLIMCAVTLIRSLLRYLYLYIFETSSQGMLYTLRDNVYRKLIVKDFGFYNKNRTGDLMSRETGDMDALRHFVAYVIYNMYNDVLFIRHCNCYDLHRGMETCTLYVCTCTCYCCLYF